MSDEPYLSLQRFLGDGVTTDWTINFAGGNPPYISVTDVEAYEVIPATLLLPEVRIPREITYIGPAQFRVTPPAADGNILVIRRKSEDRFNLVDFQSLQAVSEYDLDLANKQLLYLSQEAVDQARLAEERSIVAETIAYSSVNDASEALATAILADTKADAAVVTAGNANSAAGAAVSTANAAAALAGTADGKANTAVSTANTALNTANSADSKATTALANSSTAISTANAASVVAIGAAEDAAEALTAASEAELAAEDAQVRAQAAEAATVTAVAAAGNAVSVANGIDAKATSALAAAEAAVDTANEAMELITDAGVATFNGRAGVVLPEAGDYTAEMVEFNPGISVQDAIEDVQEYTDVLTVHVNSEINRISNQFTATIASAMDQKLDKTGQAADSQRLGGQNITYFASAAALTAGLASKLGTNGEAASAATAVKLTTPRAINGVPFDGTQNITIKDSTALPLTGGDVTGEIRMLGTSTNYAGLGMTPSIPYSLRIHSPNMGFTYIGARNTTASHYESSTGAHYFYGAVVVAGNITAYSDIRVKTDLEPIRNPLDKLARLGGYTYARTDIECPRQAGIIAQQVQEVLPEGVRVDPETGHLFVNYNAVLALMVEAINDLRDEVRSLRNGDA